MYLQICTASQINTGFIKTIPEIDEKQVILDLFQEVMKNEQALQRLIIQLEEYCLEDHDHNDEILRKLSILPDSELLMVLFSLTPPKIHRILPRLEPHIKKRILDSGLIANCPEQAKPAIEKILYHQKRLDSDDGRRYRILTYAND